MERRPTEKFPLKKADLDVCRSHDVVLTGSDLHIFCGQILRVVFVLNRVVRSNVISREYRLLE